jgi:hypothetical protein
MGQNIIDQYTFLHFAMGVVMYFIGINLPMTIVLHIIFEVLENSEQGIKFINNNLKWFWPGGKNVPDAKINSVGDTIGVIVGWLTGYYLDKLGKKYDWVNYIP